MNGDNIEDLNTAHWKLLGTIIWGALIFALLTLLQIVAMGIWFGLQGKTPQAADFTSITNGNALTLIVILPGIICILATLAAIKLKKQATIKRYLCINAVYLKPTLKWLALMLIFLTFSEMAAYFLKDESATKFMVQTYETANPLWLFYVAVVLVAPLFEEIFFRGFLLKGLSSSFLGQYGAVVITAALWALIHLQYSAYYIGIIFGLGLIFGLAKLKTNSILTPLILHMANNFIALMMAAYLA